MTRRFMARCGDEIQLMLEELSEGKWRGSVVPLASVGSSLRCLSVPFAAVHEEEAMKVAEATARSRLPNRTRELETLQWLDFSNLSDEEWEKLVT